MDVETESHGGRHIHTHMCVCVSTLQQHTQNTAPPTTDEEVQGAMRWMIRSELLLVSLSFSFPSRRNSGCAEYRVLLSNWIVVRFGILSGLWNSINEATFMFCLFINTLHPLPSGEWKMSLTRRGIHAPAIWIPRSSTCRSCGTPTSRHG